MRLTTETFGSGDQSWLASNHGTDNSRTSTVTVSNFTKSTHYPDGYLPSGTPVDVADEGDAKPFADAAGAQLGFVLTDQPIPDGATTVAVPVLRHGTVRVDKVPGDFAVPATAAQPSFVFVDGSDA